jgi:hypothetical protein
LGVGVATVHAAAQKRKDRRSETPVVSEPVSGEVVFDAEILFVVLKPSGLRTTEKDSHWEPD